MATAKKLSDYLSGLFNPITNPGGGFSVLAGPTTPKTYQSLAGPVAPKTYQSLAGPVVPKTYASLSSLAAPASTKPAAPVVAATPVAPPPVVTRSVVPTGPTGPAAPLFSGATGPTAPVGATGGTGTAIPPQWLRADGTIKTAAEIAADVAKTLSAAHDNGDVGTLALEQFGGNGQTTAEAEAEARRIGNTRNDIAVGATDPYKVASESGIAYTPEELNAIEKAYAGVYDPALDTALAKVTDKQAADKAKAAADAQANQPFTLGKDEVRYDGQGNPIAVGASSASGTGTYVPGQDPVADSWVKFVQGGGAITAVPDAYKNSVAQGLAAASNSGQLSKTSLDALGIINQLQNDPGIDALSGTGFIGGIEHPSSLFPGTKVQNAQNLAKQLQATISLGNRQQLKGSGAISDFEFKVLGDAATQLGLDGNGRTNLSADQFKTALANLELKLAVGPLKTLTDDQVQYLASPAGGSATPDEIRALDSGGSFSDVGNTTASKKVSLGTGNRPQRNNNPGDLKTGGLSDSLAIGTDDKGHLIFPDVTTGIKALTADLTAKVNGGSKYLPKNPTIAQLGKAYAEDPNWGARVASILGVSASTPTGTIPIAALAHAIAQQEGFYA